MFFFCSYVNKNKLWYKKYHSDRKIFAAWQDELGIPCFIIPHAYPILKPLNYTLHLTFQRLLDGKSLVNDRKSPHLQIVVDFGHAEHFPSCTCDKWKRAPPPCCHMFKIFRCSPIFDNDCLSSFYRSNPIFKFHLAVISNNLIEGTSILN